MSSAIDRLIAELSRLPGVGPRSARRLALHLLKVRTRSIPPLIAALTAANEQVKNCSQCGSLDDTDPCRICTDARRDATLICVVEDVADVWAMERSGAFRGRYHVLGGTLSAIDGRGPEALRIEPLLTRIASEGVAELILALSATVSGQTTAHYVAERIASLSSLPPLAGGEGGGSAGPTSNAEDAARAPSPNPSRKQEGEIKITQLAQGIPMGGELDYMDDGTLSAALSARVNY